MKELLAQIARGEAPKPLHVAAPLVARGLVHVATKGNDLKIGLTRKGYLTLGAHLLG